MVVEDGQLAKVGALEKATNAEARLAGVRRKMRGLLDPGFRAELAVVGEMDGLVVGSYVSEQGEWIFDGGRQGFDERWALVEHRGRRATRARTEAGPARAGRTGSNSTSHPAPMACGGRRPF